MNGGFEKQGDEREELETGVGVITFKLDGCSACWELKHKLKEEGITFQNVSVDDNPKLGDALEHEYSTEYYPIVQIINNRIVINIPIPPYLEIKKANKLDLDHFFSALGMLHLIRTSTNNSYIIKTQNNHLNW